MSTTTLALGALELVLLVTSGLVVGRSLVRRAAAWGLACVCVAIPLAMPAEPAFVRAVAALASIFPVLRTIEVTADVRSHPAALRMFAYVAPLDAFAITRAAPRLDVGGLRHAAIAFVVAAPGIALVLAAPEGPWRWPAALVGATIGLYATMDGMSALDRALLRAVGLESPPVQEAPILSRSIAEFWGRRWNRAVGGWLRKHCFAPLARRGRARAGLVASFVASAALHVWPVWVAIGAAPAAAMGTFFVLQAGLVWLESRLGVGRWSRPAGHAWAVLWLVGTSPLFVGPVLLIAGFR